MSVLKIDTDSYVEAAGLAATAGRGLEEAVLSANAVLVRTGGMAGWDSMGAEWADSYDPTARDILQACQALALASSDTARALTFSAGNYISAEHVASMGVAAFIMPTTPASIRETMAPCIPSAGEPTPGSPPESWDIVAGLAGVIWPAGDPGLLREAASTFRTLGSEIDTEIDGPTQQAVTSLEGLIGEDTTLFRERSAHLRDAGALLAQSSREVAASCESLAGAIETAHDELIHETRVFVADFIALAAIGTIGSFVTLGGAGAITSIIGAARVAQLVLRVHQVIARLSALTKGALVMASRLPGASRLTAGLQALAKSPAALQSTAGAAGRSLAASAPRTSAAIVRLAPAVRVAGRTGLRVLDSRAVSVATSSPAAWLGQIASSQARRRLLVGTAGRGDATDEALSAVSRVAVIGQAALTVRSAHRTKERWDAGTALVALPGSLTERYAPTAPKELAPGASGPGRLTAVQGSPDRGPTAASSRGRRTSRPAASP